MTSQIGTWIAKNRWIVIAVGLPVLVAAWWAFRPEKLWINEKVNEPAPFVVAAAEPQPLFTGRLEGKAHQTSGRATIYKSPDGKLYLRLSDFTTSNGPDVHIVLARSDDKNLEYDLVKGNLDDIELGTLKGNQGDQNYSLPTSTNLNDYRAVVVYCERFHAVFGLARLQPF
jgi:hypothetical protein